MATTEADLIELRAKVKESKANIEILPFMDETMQGDEHFDDVFLVEMATSKRDTVSVTPTRRGELRVFPDADFKQLVLVSREPERSITREMSFIHYEGTNSSKTATQVRETVRREIRSGHRFPVSMAEGTKYQIKRGTLSVEPKTPGTWEVNVEVTATSPVTEMCFLVGQDEKAMFISLLPKTVRTVAAAHNALRPKGVPKDALRQGEFFFVPVNQKLQASLDRRIQNQPTQLHNAEYLDYNGDTHLGQLVLNLGNETYAIGFVVDDQDRHELLFLTEWHKVIHNLELDPPNGMDTGSWD